MSKPLPTPETLRKLLRYDPEAGKLFWQDRTPDMFSNSKGSSVRVCSAWNAKFSGKEAFTAMCSCGYNQGSIYGGGYRAHRVIWALVNGSWPSGEIDHENGVRDDNRIDNLRDVSHGENSRNRRMSVKNKSGVCGVFYNPPRRKWWAQIKVNQKSIHLGLFTEKCDAIDARKKAETKYGFHVNHGRKKNV